MLLQHVLHYFKIKDNFWLQYLAEMRFPHSVRYYAVLVSSLERTEVTLVTEYVFTDIKPLFSVREIRL